MNNLRRLNGLKKKYWLPLVAILFVFFSYEPGFSNEFKLLYDSANRHRSVKLAKHVLDLALKSNDQAKIAQSYFLIAYLQQANSMYYKALNNYFSALIYYEQADNPGYQINTLISIGIIYSKAGFYTKALSFYREGLDISRKRNLDRSSVALLEYQMAKAYRLTGDLTQAERHHQAVLQYYQSTNNRLMMSDIYAELGLINLELRKFPESKKHYDLSVSILADDAETRKTAVLKKMNSLAYRYMLGGDLDTARHILQSAIALMEGKDSHHVQFQIYENLAAIYKGLGDPDSAAILYERSLAFADTNRFDQDYLAACKYLYDHHKSDPGRSEPFMEAIFGFASQLSAFRDQLSQAHVKYQVEAAEYKRQLKHNKYVHRVQTRINFIAYPGLIIIIFIILYYFYRKEENRAKRAASLLRSLGKV